MRIKEFSISRYGPLPETGRIPLSDFSLIFGKNDDGKTLTIDAIVRLLLKVGRSLFRNIDRVDEAPEGYLILDYEGEELKLPEKGYLSDIAGLTSQDFRNVFIIRDSDLSVASEGEFYEGVTDRLTGLRTREISSIRERLRELGRLTRADSNGRLSDSANFEKVGSRVDRTYHLIAEIERLEDELKHESFDELEERVAKTKEDTSSCEQELSDFEDARKRERYEKTRRALDSIQSATKQLEALGVYSDDEERLWSGAETQIVTYAETETELSSELDSKQSALEKRGEYLEEKKRDFRVIESLKEEVAKEIEPDMATYKMRSGELAQQKSRTNLFIVAAIVSALLLGTSILGIAVKPAPLFYVLAALFLVALLVSAAFVFLFIYGKSWLAGVFERIKLRASSLGLGGESIEEILSKIREFDNGRTKMKEELADIERHVNLLKEQTKDLKENKLPGVRQKIREVREKTDGLRRKVGVETLEDYREKLKLKKECEDSVEWHSRMLKDNLGSKGETLHENISYWRDEVDGLEQFKAKAKDIVWDEKAVSERSGILNDLRKKEQELRHMMADFSKQLADVGTEANEILMLEDDRVHCGTSSDLKAIKDRLQDFILKVEENRDNTLAVMELFEEIEQEEEEKVSHLFGKDSLVSKYFSEITGGIYEEAEFVSDESGERRIRVRFKNGDTLYADRLLGGAYDQLYFSVRLALGEKLLKGSTGFFIMDDPFVKADTERLRRQIDILKRISKLGWQIIYFTAKDEMKDALKQDIKGGKVIHVSLKGIFS